MGRKKEENITEKISDWLDRYDRLTYWHKNKIIVYGAILVILLAPVCDYFFDREQRYTYYSTNLYSFLMITLLASWINRWRDENYNWSFKGFIDRLKIYINLFILAKDEVSRDKNIEERLYNISYYSFYGGIIIAGFGKVSLCIRKAFEIENSIQENFETFSNYSLVFSFIGVCIFLYIYYKYPGYIKIGSLLKSIKPNSVDWSNFTTGGIFVMNSKNPSHIDSLITANSNNEILKNFLLSIKDWNPGRNFDEKVYQNKLIRLLRKKMQDEVVDYECLIGERDDINRGKADIVISNTILIEMKKNINSSEAQKAVGQTRQYINVWKDRGLVILLLCDISHNYAQEYFSEFIKEQNNLNKRVIAIVVSDRQ